MFQYRFPSKIKLMARFIVITRSFRRFKNDFLWEYNWALTSGD